MKPWQCIVVGLVLLAAAGCRVDPAIPILERQLRIKEDEIYRLRGTIEDIQDGAVVSDDRRAGGRSRSSSADSDDDRPRRRSNGSAANGAQPPAVEMPSQSSGKVPDALKSPAGSPPSDVPEVPEHLRGPSKPLDGSGGSSALPSERSDEQDGPALDRDTAAREPRRLDAGPSRAVSAGRIAGLPAAVPFTPTADSRRVAAVALDRSLTGGIASDDGSGDQGLLVVVEPRDRAGRTIDAPAEMSIVVLDPAVQGDASLLSRWDFTAAETAAMFRRAGRSRAIHVTTAWTAEPPKHNKLHLYVRYVTSDGRKLETDQPIEVALAGQRTADWKPSTDGPSRPPVRTSDTRSNRPVWSPDRR